MTKQEYNQFLEAEVFPAKCSLIYRLYYRLIGLYLDGPHHAIYLIRTMQYSASHKGIFYFFRTLLIQKRLLQKYSMHISPYCIIGKGLHLPHPIGIVIGKHVIIGEYCSIYQCVTLGGGRTGDVKKHNQPTIGDNVTIFAGAMVLGKLHVNDNSIIAANSVLLKDTEGSGVYAGSPARKVK